MTFSRISETLIIADPTVAEYQSLISSVGSGSDVVVLDPTRDGVEQITELLADRANLASLHILSHGEPGTLFLGKAQLNEATLDRYKGQIQQWATAFAQQADILIYGCRVALGDRGRQFMQQIQTLTGAAVAASATLTGNAALGGDWNLEVTTGSVRSSIAFSPTARAAYAHVLAVRALPNLVYGVSGSDLRVVDIDTGTSRSVGTLAFPSFAIARDAATGRVYYIESANGPTARVAYWDPDTRTNTVIGTTGADLTFLKLGQSRDADQTLYGLGTDTNLYRIDPDPGATPRAVLLGPITGGDPAFSVGTGDAAFDPTNPNRLYVIVTTPDPGGYYRLYSVDVRTRRATFIGDTGLNPDPANSGSLAFGSDGQLYATSTRGGAPALYRLNRQTAAATFIGTTAVGFNDFGSLPVAVNADLQITLTDGLTEVQAGKTITYTMVVKNNSNIDLDRTTPIDITSTIPSQLENVTWSGKISGGGNFIGSSTGTGDVDEQVALDANATVTYTIRGRVKSGTPNDTTLRATAQVAPPDGITDPNSANNRATDTTTVVDQPSTNQPPTADSTTISVKPSFTKLVSGLGATDPNGDDTIDFFTIESLPQGGTLYLGNPKESGAEKIEKGQKVDPDRIDEIYFTADSDFDGSKFSYTATDDEGERSKKASATINVNTGGGGDGNQPPTVEDVTITIPDPQPAVVKVTGLSATDPDGTVKSFTILSLPENGTLYLGDPRSGGTAVTANQTLQPNQIQNLFFQPVSDFSGATFDYTATDNDNAEADEPGIVQFATSGGTEGCEPGLNIRGTNGNDSGSKSLKGTQDSDTLRGFPGNDNLDGRSCDDTLSGGLGKDSLRGGKGQDVLQGGRDADRLVGARNNDTLEAGRGDDYGQGDTGNDSIFGDTGKDTLFGGSGNDIVQGGDGDDRIRGEKGRDRLTGDDGEDRLRSDQDNDTLTGGNGHDQLSGRSGSDSLYGGNRGDTLTGGRGGDIIRTGSGEDIVVYKGTNDPRDTITDFNVAKDKIDVTFIVNDNYGKSNKFKQYVSLRQDGNNTLFRFDGNGDARGGFRTVAVINGLSPSDLAARNFIF